MRIKYKRGMTPDIIAIHFLDYCKDKLIGAVNIYVQEYDDSMKLIRDNGEYLEIAPGDITTEKYAEYEADQRRRRMKAV